uniref:Ubiquitin associated and SH3 domain containing A n=1 Tax=Junco hyemalis TaxID=40217 RepID=A0A8C5NR01_JUNHY
MAVAEAQLYSKVSNKPRGRGTSALLEPLLAKGFPAHLAQKALVATGQKTVEDAVKWLHSHCNDPSLDDPIPQEYALYLCPRGRLHSRLQDFWRESKRQCGKNRAHEVFPHVTLCDFFTCEDQKVEFLYDVLKKVGDSFCQIFPPSIFLTLHASPSYLGFFIDDCQANILKDFAVAFSTEASALAGTGPNTLAQPHHSFPSLKQFHLTLAHRFYPHHQKTLEQLAKCINPGEPCQWVAALYSRDMRFVHYQRLRALFQYKPQNIDELMINAGDLIYVDPRQQNEAGEGWVIGTSHRTGCRGFLPENYTERAHESDTWVKHRSLTKTEKEPNVKPNGEAHNLSMSRSVTNVVSLQNTALRRGVLVMSHGERVDQVFGKSWLQQCLTADGKYYRADLNFPSSLPRQKDSMKQFECDPPLSCCGIFQSRLIGEALLEQEVTVSSVYSSPALRCVQTAQHVLQGLKLNQKVRIRVEPGLFEWTKWEASRAIPKFMTVAELVEASYDIDTSYRANFPLSSLVPSESYEDYVSRSSAVIKHIISACPCKGRGLRSLNILSDSCRLPSRDSRDFAQMVQKIPALGMCFCEEQKEENKWQMVNPPVKTLTHGANAAFNWRNTIMED